MSEHETIDDVEGVEGEVAVGGRSPWFRRGVVLLSVSVVLGVLVVAAGAFAFWSIYDDAVIPSPDELTIPDPTLVRDQDDGPLARLQPAEVRRNLALDQLPEHVPQAVLAAEDRAFYDHSGISPRGIVRAAWANVRRGERVQGASTIPQQYVQLAITDIPDTYLGKFREAATAVRLDRELSKDQILENYLNAVPWGRQAYGIEAAARTYFDVGAMDLDLHQSAVLAGMIAAPTAFDPARHPDRAAIRRDFVLQGMVAIDAITQAEADELIGTDLPELRSRPLVNFGAEAYFVDAVEREVARILEQLEDDRDPTVGLRITTTYDPRAQELALEKLNETLDGTEHTGSVVTIDHETGAVKALVGGRDYREQQYNVAIGRQSLRSPGSAFKTFALAAFVAEGWDPDATRLDGRDEQVFEREDGQEDYEVSNFGGQSFPDLTVREATVRSVNTAYVSLSEAIGYDAVTETATQLGVDSELSPVPSAVLGSQGVTPLEMAEAYATLANGGVRHDPFVISRIRTHDGEELFRHEVEDDEVYDANAAAVVTDVLVDVVRSGTGTAAQTRHPTAGKTGTTNDSRDAWFVGYTPSLTTAIWVGNLDNSPMGDVTGGAVPAVIFGNYMDELVGDEEPGAFPTPDFSQLERFRELRPAPPPPPPPSPSRDDDDDDDDEDDGDDEGEDDGDDEGEDDNGDDDNGDDDNGNGNDDNGGDDDNGNGNGNGGNGGDDGNGGNGGNGGDDGDDGEATDDGTEDADTETVAADGGPTEDDP
ncbi:transglycosylase domain-containing protein [Nitriliruptor alkaliphilus]|uniref:transglycosylase domain-containing protein n=1 Tax=Nitriliruptor alkaliphilus TaxID=427918 RepID=UPI000697F9A5|nr:transglycosylase domain-containing protein [Nitriliruptor alkaliphilus]